MIIERTYDINIINYVFRHKSVEKFIDDDFSQDVEYLLLDNIYYLAAIENGTIAGMFLGIPLNGVTIDAHIAILPKFYGKKAREAGKLAIKWMFDNTELYKINASIPVYNKRSIKYTEDIGLKKEGINKNSIMKNGKLFNQIYFGLERAICHQQ